MQEQKHGLTVNVDGDALWYISNMIRRDYTDLEAKLRAYARRYGGHGITDMVYAVSGQCSSVPSDVLTFYGEKAEWKEENGIPVDYSGCDRIFIYRDMHKVIPDCYGVILDETRRCGMNAWISVRMNDCHDSNKQTSFLRGRLFYEADRNGWMLRGCDGVPPYFQTCFNYAKEPIRKIMLDYIREQVTRLDPDGLELDFQREIFCFDYLHEKNAAAIMTEFISCVRAILDEQGKKSGRHIKLAVRVLRDIAHNLAFGFDAAEWLRRGLVDVLVPSPRWGTCDHAMPIADWKALAAGRAEIWAGQEILCDVSDSAANIGLAILKQTPETAKGFAAQYFAEGADNAYLYNFYQTCFPGDMELLPGHTAPDFSWASGVWEGCRSPKAAETGTRRHVAGYQDICPDGYERFCPFPMTIDGEAEFPMQTGKIRKGDRVTLLLGFAPDAGLPTAVTVDGAVATPVSDGDSFLASRIATIANDDAREKAKRWVTTLCYLVCAGEGNARRIRVSAEHAVLKYVEITVTHA